MAPPALPRKKDSLRKKRKPRSTRVARSEVRTAWESLAIVVANALERVLHGIPCRDELVSLAIAVANALGRAIGQHVWSGRG